MDAKDLRTESAQSDRTKDGDTKYPQESALQQCNRSKPYQDIGSSSLGKVDTQAGRPCAVIGPDRVVPPPAAADTYLKKTTLEPWCVDAYRRPLEHPHKMNEYHLPNRNISPRQTFQENMQRIMLPASYNLSKIKDNYHPESNITSVRNNKLSLPSETKYCEMPYAVNSAYSEQKTTRNTDINVPLNATFARSGPHPQGWVPSNTMRSAKPYGVPEMYQYADPSSCGASRPVFMPGPHRPLHEEPSHMYSDSYYQDSNLRFKPYPSVKDRVQQVRYEYLGNYTTPFQPSPFPSHKHDLQKSMPSHAYSGYPQVPFKYLDTRLGEQPVNSYQRPINQQTNCSNVTFRNPVIHPSYASVPGNLQANKFYYPPENPVKNIPMTRLPYDTNNKLYMDYDNFRPKPYAIPEGYYFNENRSHNIKSQGLPPTNFPIPNVQRTRMPMPYYRSENPAMKGYEYNPNIRNFDPSLMSLHSNNSLSRFPSQFSPNNIAMSPSDSNPSTDINQIQGISQEELGYASQSAPTSLRNTDVGLHRMMSDPYGRYDYRYGVQIKHAAMPSKSEMNSAAAKSKKDIDVRQFLQMWNEGEDEGNENNKDVNNKHVNTNDLSQQGDNHNQEQLYVLGLVNVPREELGKYEHIEKVSKLPENIKGYNSIELLNQFEEVIESSKLNNFSPKATQTRDTRLPIRTSQPLHGMNMPLQAVNVIPHGMHMPPRPLSPLDVEAKISQSVIHKEVGCNFEIKPCSPKILNVEIAAPVQTLLGERVIEKVSNSASVPSVLQSVGELESCKTAKLAEHNVSPEENLKAPSCKMISNVFNDNVKTNYSLHDLESNSGICLASLPRLDNDCEFNFPEVNQQFINANKETVITSALKDLPTINVNSPNVDKREDLQTPMPDQGKGICKLSKYRKSRNKTESDDKSHDLNSQHLRTDSVIIKNPDNVKIYEDTSEEKHLQLTTQSPINLTLHDEDRVNNDTRNSEVVNDVSNVTTAIDYSAKANDVSRCENNFEKINGPVKQIIDFEHHSKPIIKTHEMINHSTHTNTRDETKNITQKELTKINELITAANPSMDVLHSQDTIELSNQNKSPKNNYFFNNNKGISNTAENTILAYKDTQNHTVEDVIAEEITTDINNTRPEVTPDVVELIEEKSFPINKKLIPGTEIFEEDFSEISGLSIATGDIKNKTEICIFRQKKVNFTKETFSPQIQLLFLHPEGLCKDSVDRNLESADTHLTNKEVNQTKSSLEHTNIDCISNCSANFQANEQVNVDFVENNKEHLRKDDTLENDVTNSKSVDCLLSEEGRTKANDGLLSNKGLLMPENAILYCSDSNSENISECKEKNPQDTEMFSSDVNDSANDSKITSEKMIDKVNLMETETICSLKFSSEQTRDVISVNNENKCLSLTLENNALKRSQSPPLEVTFEANAMNKNCALSIKSKRDDSEIFATRTSVEREICADNDNVVQENDSNTMSENENNFEIKDEGETIIGEPNINENKHHSNDEIKPKTIDINECYTVEDDKLDGDRNCNQFNTNEEQLSKEISSTELGRNKFTEGNENTEDSKNKYFSIENEHKLIENESKKKSGDNNTYSELEINKLSRANKHILFTAKQNDFNTGYVSKLSSGIAIERKNDFILQKQSSHTIPNSIKHNEDSKIQLCADTTSNFSTGNKTSSTFECSFIREDETKHISGTKLTPEDTNKLIRDNDELCSAKENSSNSGEENANCSALDHELEKEDKNNSIIVNKTKITTEETSYLSSDSGTKVTDQETTESPSDMKEISTGDKSNVSCILERKSVDINKLILDDKNNLSAINEIECDTSMIEYKLGADDDIQVYKGSKNKVSADENDFSVCDINSASTRNKVFAENQEELSPNPNDGNKHLFKDEIKFRLEDENELAIDSNEIREITHCNETFCEEIENGCDMTHDMLEIAVDKNNFNTDKENKSSMKDELTVKYKNTSSTNSNTICSIAKSSNFSATSGSKISIDENNYFTIENNDDGDNQFILQEGTLTSHSDNEPKAEEINTSADDKNNCEAVNKNKKTKKIHVEEEQTKTAYSTSNFIHNSVEIAVPTSVSDSIRTTDVTAKIQIAEDTCDKSNENALEYVVRDTQDDFVQSKQKSIERLDTEFHHQMSHEKTDNDAMACFDTLHNAQTNCIISSTTHFTDVYSEFDEETIKLIKLPAPVSPSNMLETEEICEYRDFQDNSDENVGVLKTYSPRKECDTIEKSTRHAIQNKDKTVYESNKDIDDYCSITDVECCEENLSDIHTNMIEITGEDENVDVNITLGSVNQLELEECFADQENLSSHSTDNNEVIHPMCTQRKELINLNEKYVNTTSSNFVGEFTKAPNRKRKKLKRSLSDSALNIYTDDLQESDAWAEKRKRVAEPENEPEPPLLTENFSINLINNRRNSVSSFYTEENVSFCILIDDNCIIAEENNEEEKICFAEIPEEFIEYQASEADNNNVVTELESQVVHLQTSDLTVSGYTNCHTLVSEEERVVEDSWFDDVACVETVVSEDISDDVIVSATSTPINTDISEEEIENNYNQDSSTVDVCMNYHSDKVKHIYGDKMCSNDAELVDTLYRTPQMNMNKTLSCKDSSEDSSGYYNTETLEEVLSESTSERQSLSPIVENVLSINENTELLKENIESTSIEVKEHTNLKSFDEDDDTIKTQDDTVNSCESSVDVDFRQKESTPHSIPMSSSPEVSSTTEEKNSTIMLKITNYGGSRIAEVNNINNEETKKNTVCCKYTEKREYLSYENNLSRPLITKAAKKYIPPLEDTVKDLKVKLRLPQKSLNKLKLLKVSKEEPKPNLSKSKLSHKDNPKKAKPKFEDVLKSIDEIQYKMHKEKSKKVKKTVPKVVIKKCENGSHYASTADREKNNPDLTGQKWQPWVFLERNRFIDKMATQHKTKAVYSHRKNMYILAETFKKYKSAVASGVKDTKHSFVISQQALNDNDSGKLKYTIRLKHAY